LEIPILRMRKPETKGDIGETTPPNGRRTIDITLDTDIRRECTRGRLDTPCEIRQRPAQAPPRRSDRHDQQYGEDQQPTTDPTLDRTCCHTEH
jgi:hypothetical protein